VCPRSWEKGEERLEKKKKNGRVKRDRDLQRNRKRGKHLKVGETRNGEIE